MRNVGALANNCPFFGACSKNVAINVHFNPGQVNLENITITNARTKSGYGIVELKDGDATFVRNLTIDTASASSTSRAIKVESTTGT